MAPQNKGTVADDTDFDVVFQLLGEIMGDPKVVKRKIGFIEDRKKSN